MTKRAARKAVPAFATERAEREFWETHDASPFIDWDQARVAVFPNLKPSTETISLRLPTALLSELKALASKQHVPYQSLLKVFLADRVAREISRIDAVPGHAQRATSRGRRRARRKTSSPRARG
jgi:predicted DNA binding CopG/RHH family protein